MAGHSKWANIKYRKAAVDSKRAKIFTKLQRDIYIAALHGSDPDKNSKLKLAIQRSRQFNISKDIIEKAIKKASGVDNKDTFFDVRYNISFGNAAFVVTGKTDNKNRTVSNVKEIATKNNANFLETGAIEYLFQYVGLCRYKGENIDFDNFFDVCVSNGAIDVESEEDGVFSIQTEPKDLHAISNKVSDFFKIEASNIDILYIPKEEIVINDPDKHKIAVNIVEKLEDLDDIDDVFVNFVDFHG